VRQERKRHAVIKCLQNYVLWLRVREKGDISGTHPVMETVSLQGR
jgi:hypothetical protein